ncbi:MAG: metalloregulator ArsR/SmtB family transcription factor [Peptococcaceae bacterium]|nr:metalloregulator ArsR/SmtB family transcription factor [Peptococcaceae bacterium]
MNDVLNLFHILSDKTRLRILLLLLDHELCVCEIFASLDMSQPRVSGQLAVLKQARLIRDRREGKWIYYKIEENADTEYLIRILRLLPDWLKDDPEFLRDKEMLNKIFSFKNGLEICNCILPGGENIGK